MTRFAPPWISPDDHDRRIPNQAIAKALVFVVFFRPSRSTTLWKCTSMHAPSFGGEVRGLNKARRKTVPPQDPLLSIAASSTFVRRNLKRTSLPPCVSSAALRWLCVCGVLGSETTGLVVLRARSTLRLLESNPCELTAEDKAKAVGEDDLLKISKTKKARVVGTMRLIGMIYLRRIMTAPTLRGVISKLLANTKSGKGPDEYLLDCVVEVLTIVGEALSLGCLRCC